MLAQTQLNLKKEQHGYSEQQVLYCGFPKISNEHNSTMDEWIQQSERRQWHFFTFNSSLLQKRISGFKMGLLCNVASLPFAYMRSVGDLFCPGTRWFMDALATMLPPLLTFTWFSHRLFNFGRRNPLPRRQVQFPSTQSRSSPSQVYGGFNLYSNLERLLHKNSFWFQIFCLTALHCQGASYD